jgi:two-component system chemotaxis sensor kinase CheA
MALDVDDDILQDFLIEAGEILESLSQQLVDLESNPEDIELLNAIFRGYHTVKGGAGFLGLTSLVDICHLAENVFDLLRKQEQRVTPELMDVALRALDCVNDMFETVKSGQEPDAADPDLVAALERYSQPSETNTEQDAADSASEVVQDEFDDLFDAVAKDNGAASAEDEFDALLDELHGGQSAGLPDGSVEARNESSSDSDVMSDDEFEALLDELHGPGHFSTETPEAGQDESRGVSSDEITEDEFEALLDQIHGPGKAPGMGEPAPSPPRKADGKVGKSGKTGGTSSGVRAGQQSHASSATAGKADQASRADKASSPVRKEAAAQASRSSARPTLPKVTTETTVRVDTRRLDDIMNLVGELVLVRNRLVSLAQNNHDEGLLKAISSLDVVTGDLQGAVMKTRMQPIKKVFGRFPRVVRDLARNLGKEITLDMSGEETDLDKNLVEALADPLVHLVRNSVDHGIEMPSEREKRGKPRVGTIRLSAAQEGDHIRLTIEDDGGGMDPDVLRQKAVDKGLMDKEAAARLTPAECFNLIFMPGFSTKENVSDISGRGVGMDVVKTRIAQLNGTIAIDSELGEGTRIDIKVPLTLAILPTLMVTVGRGIFALPLASVNEIFHLDLTRINMVDGQRTVVVRGKPIPLFYLQDWLLPQKQAQEYPKEGHVVLLQAGTRRVAFVVDGLIGQEEVVIKPLGPVLHGTPGMAGATITSDGTIALILDVPGLLQHYGKRRTNGSS